MAKSDTRSDPKLDDVDQKIVDCVIQNPKVSVEAIAAQLNEDYSIDLSESTIQKRVADLLNDHVLERRIVVQNWNSAGYPFRYRIDAIADTGQLRLGRGGRLDDKTPVRTQQQLAEYIKNILGRQYQDRLVILDVAIVFGGANADISITMRTREHRDVFEFVTGGLRDLGGIESTMTFQEPWIYGEPSA